MNYMPSIALDKLMPMLRPRKKTSPPGPSIEMIAGYVAGETKVSVERMQKKTRVHEVVQARQITMHLAKLFTKNSLKTIGKFFGGRDHTTVIYSCQTVNNLCDSDPNYRAMIQTFESRFA